MQRLSRELRRALATRLPLRAVAWGGRQTALPIFLALALPRVAAWLAAGHRGEPSILLAGDVALAPVCLALGRAAGVPVATVAHGLDMTYPNRAYQAAIRPALAHVDLVIAISQSTRQLALARGALPERTISIPPGIDPDPAVPRALARSIVSTRLGRSLDDAPLLLSVGRLVPRKGIAWFVEQALPAIVARHPTARLAIAGDGPERTAIGAVSAALPVHLLGAVTDELRAALYAAADLFIMPNRARGGDAEGFGLVAAEAAFAGLPVVATSLEGIVDAVAPERTGRLVPPEDAAALAAAIDELLADPAARHRLTESARHYAAAHFSWDSVGDRYADALARLTRGSGDGMGAVARRRLDPA